MIFYNNKKVKYDNDGNVIFGILYGAITDSNGLYYMSARHPNKKHKQQPKLKP